MKQNTSLSSHQTLWKRRLSLEHVRALHDKLLIPADVLIQAY
jgi:antitoxin component HigA of HigAB toxin-antitoxin module